MSELTYVLRLKELADYLDLQPNVLLVLEFMLLALMVGTLVRLLAIRTANPDHRNSRLGSLKAWWTLYLIFTLAILSGRLGGILLIAVLSLLALREFLSLLSPERSRWHVHFWVFVAIALHYLWIYLDLFAIFLVFIPVGVFLFLPMRMVLTGNTRGFLRDVYP